VIHRARRAVGPLELLRAILGLDPPLQPGTFVPRRVVYTLEPSVELTTPLYVDEVPVPARLSHELAGILESLRVPAYLHAAEAREVRRCLPVDGAGLLFIWDPRPGDVEVVIPRDRCGPRKRIHVRVFSERGT
jgi:hypothetical protein